jgi:hypothetical protein
MRNTCSGLIYRPSPKHCEPITAARPGTKCPAWTRDVAQELLDGSVSDGDKRFNTREGLAFVAQSTGDGTWHGYPEAWDQVPERIRRAWLDEGRVRSRDLRRWARLRDVRMAWNEA